MNLSLSFSFFYVRPCYWVYMVCTLELDIHQRFDLSFSPLGARKVEDGGAITCFP